MGAYPQLCAAVEIISGYNDGIRFKENATTATATLAPGTYFLRGDDTDPTDLCKIVKDALEAATVEANEYDVDVAWSTSPSSPCATVTIHRALGSKTFQILWADAATTFNPAQLGFEATNSALDANDKVSTLTPSLVWAGNDLCRHFEAVQEMDVETPRANSGFVRAVDNGGPYHSMRVMFRLQNERRTKVVRIPSDPNRAFGRFLSNHATGFFEFHLADIATGSTLVDPSTSNLVPGINEDEWIFEAGIAKRFDPEREGTGAALYSWEMEFLERVST